MKVVEVAIICHMANKAYCESIGDNSQTSWEDAPEWQKESAVIGVQFHLENPKAIPMESHQNWCNQKKAEGWKYGPVKDVEKKEHPCFVHYDQLPEEQKIKDYLFSSIVKGLSKFVK